MVAGLMWVLLAAQDAPLRELQAALSTWDVVSAARADPAQRIVLRRNEAAFGGQTSGSNSDLSAIPKEYSHLELLLSRIPSDPRPQA